MFHAINQWLSRHARQILEIGLTRDNAVAAAQGWNARQVKLGTWSYRDPRFIYRSFEFTQPSTGCTWCDGKLAGWIDDSDLASGNRKVKIRRWS
jgi:hypothetical protein